MVAHHRLGQVADGEARLAQPAAVVGLLAVEEEAPRVPRPDRGVGLALSTSAAPVAHSTSAGRSYAATVRTISARKPGRAGQRAPKRASPSIRDTDGSRRRDGKRRPSRSSIRGTAAPLRTAVSTSRRRLPGGSSRSGLRIATVRAGATCSRPTLMPPAYPRFAPLGTSRTQGRRATTAAVASAESLSTTSTRRRSPAAAAGSESSSAPTSAALL